MAQAQQTQQDEQPSEQPGMFHVRPQVDADTLEPQIGDVLRRGAVRAAMMAHYACGRGDSNLADRMAVDAWEEVLDRELPVRAKIVIGEGDRDQAPQLYIGQEYGPDLGNGPELDIAIDPLENTNGAASGTPGAICVAAAALKHEGKLFGGIDGYFNKFACGRELAIAWRNFQEMPSPSKQRLGLAVGQPMIGQPVEGIVKFVQYVTNKPPYLMVAEVLQRPRNQEYIDQLLRLGVRVNQIPDGDIVSTWKTIDPSNLVDFTIGIGAAPEGVISAAIARVLDGHFEAHWWFADDETGRAQREKVVGLGIDPEAHYSAEQLAADHVIVAFCAVTDSVVPGVHAMQEDEGLITHAVWGRSRNGSYYVETGYHRCPPAPPPGWPTITPESDR